MTKILPKTHDKLASLRAATPARIFLPCAGLALATHANLRFQLDHAEARDAVHECLDVKTLIEALRSRGLEILHLASAARDRRTYLLRPDLGRELDEASRERLVPLAGDYNIVFVVADGLSARAVSSHAIALLDEAMPVFRQGSWKLAPVVVVEQGRVAIGDEIGEILGAKLVAVLIGERPGLSSSDSLGVYLTFAPRVGRNDAERNCLSNIRSRGMSYSEAARRLFYLCGEARRRKLTGVELKDETPLGGAMADRHDCTSRKDKCIVKLLRCLANSLKARRHSGQQRIDLETHPCFPANAPDAPRRAARGDDRPTA